MPLWSELFLLLSCGRFIALIKVPSESCYRVVRLLLGGINCHAHGLGLTSEGQRGTSTEEEDKQRTTGTRELRSALPIERRASLWER
jgi:hypothetical protein